ncbi:MAG: hypothetical protein M3Y17_11085 [Actinomycetota bacterium]|nr:hypothetical protein [Actinomycetota bacterium]
MSFGLTAELYDCLRAGYPDELYADRLALAPGGRILEAGAGTGKATVEPARRGASVLTIEPDPSMAVIARRHTSDLPVDGGGS